MICLFSFQMRALRHRITWRVRKSRRSRNIFADQNPRRPPAQGCQLHYCHSRFAEGIRRPRALPICLAQEIWWNRSTGKCFSNASALNLLGLSEFQTQNFCAHSLETQGFARKKFLWSFFLSMRVASFKSNCQNSEVFGFLDITFIFFSQNIFWHLRFEIWLTVMFIKKLKLISFILINIV